MKVFYFDCSSGICGDMVISAFLDLGLNLKMINDALDKLDMPEKPMFVSKHGSKNALTGTMASVKFKSDKKHHMRSYKGIKKLIQSSRLSDFVKESSLEIFKLIGQVESKIHGVSIEKIHFHEIGAVDSIADIVASSVCFEMIFPAKIYFSRLPIGGGTIKSAHGPIPLPAPASSQILSGVPLYGIDVSEELVTPTGAAIVKTFADGFIDFPTMNLERVGTGLGKRDFKELPGVLRIFKGKINSTETDRVTVLEANIDDFNPEFYGHIFDLLFDEGALDVTLTPIIMKKGRPAQLISVICKNTDLPKLSEILLNETTTNGVRFYKSERKKLKRESIKIKTPYGTVNVKKSMTKSGARFHPEYEDLKRIAKKENLSIGKLNMEILGYIDKKS